MLGQLSEFGNTPGVSALCSVGTLPNFHRMTDTPNIPNIGVDAGFLSVVQAAEELHITPRAVRHRIQTGTLAATKLGPGTASYVITRREIERAKQDAAA